MEKYKYDISSFIIVNFIIIKCINIEWATLTSWWSGHMIEKRRRFFSIKDIQLIVIFKSEEISVGIN